MVLSGAAGAGLALIGALGLMIAREAKSLMTQLGYLEGLGAAGDAAPVCGPIFDRDVVTLATRMPAML